MNMSSSLLSPLWLWIGNLGFALVLAVALLRAPWFHLRDNEATHVWLGVCVGLLLLWTLDAGVEPGLRYHLFGATLLTLMFGWQFATISIALLVFGVTLNGDAGWAIAGWNGLLPLVAVAVSTAALRASQRWLPDNFFIYIFVVAFFGSALGVALIGLTSTGLLVVAGPYPSAWLLENHLPVFLLLLTPEGFLTGMLMSIFVVYRPRWVASFDDDRYLRGK